MTLRPLILAALAGALALAGCGKLGELERPGPMFGKAATDADAGSASSRSVRTVDPRNRNDRPAPPQAAPTDAAQTPDADPR